MFDKFDDIMACSGYDHYDHMIVMSGWWSLIEREGSPLSFQTKKQLKKYTDWRQKKATTPTDLQPSADIRGDIALAAGFIAYAGPFTAEFRARSAFGCLENGWVFSNG